MAECRRDVVYSVATGYRPLSLDLYVGDTDATAICVFLHGGGWRIGSRREGPGPVTADSGRFFHQMADRGLTVASVDYRLSGEAHYPAQLDDVTAAAIFCSARASRTSSIPSTGCRSGRRGSCSRWPRTPSLP